MLASVPGVPAPQVPPTAPPAWPRVYRVSPGWLTVWLGLGIPILLVGLAGVLIVLVVAATPGLPSPPGTMMVGIGCLAIALLGGRLVLSVVDRLSLDADGIELRGMFTTRRLTRAAIAGKRIVRVSRGPSQLILVPRDPEQRSLRIPLAFRTDDAFAAWLDDLPDLSAAAAAEMAAARRRFEAEVAASPTYGATPAARSARLAWTRRLVGGLTILAGFAAVWCFYAPWPGLAAVCAAVVLPWVGMAMVPAGGGLVRLLGARGDVRPTPFLAMLLCGGALALRAASDVNMLGWPRALGVTVLGAGLVLAILAAVDRYVLHRRFVAIAVAVFALLYAFGTVTLGNVLFDRAAPSVFRAAVLGRHMSGTRHTTWYLRLGAWGSHRWPGDVAVSRSFYAWMPAGSSVCVRTHPGAFGIAWFDLDYCNRKELARVEATALPALRRQAARGDLAAMARLGVDLTRGTGVGRDDRAARRLLGRAAAGGDGFAAYVLGLMDLAGRGAPLDDAAARRRFTQAAADGDPMGAVKLGDIYEGGIGVPPDATRALALYQDAARHGAFVAAERLGTIYRRGLGVAPDPAAAFRFDLAAARRGDLVAIDAVGECYRTGLGVIANPDRAEVWLRAAAAAGQPQAMQTLGTMLYQQPGTRRDAENAYYWLALAARFRVPGQPAPVDAATLLEQAGAAITPAQRRRIDAIVPAWRPIPPRAPSRD